MFSYFWGILVFRFSYKTCCLQQITKISHQNRKMLFAVFMFGLKQTKKWIKVICFKCFLATVLGILKIWSVAKSTCVSQSQKLDRITTGSEQEANELSFVFADYIKVLDVILTVTYGGNIILYRKDDFSFFKQVCLFHRWARKYNGGRNWTLWRSRLFPSS